MVAYHAPLRDMRFILQELDGIGPLRGLPGCDDLASDVIDPVLEEAGKLCAEVLQPLNRSGDEEGCRLEDGIVRTPKGFREAYRAYAEGGWTSLACDPAYGGQDLPHSIGVLVEEMVCSAGLSFALYPGLSFGAYIALHAHGDPSLKERYLPKLVDGSWSGTMCLTEPHCGTDLGLVRTSATPQADGSYRIAGTKIFISAGDHDLTENILHLVLARVPGAPKGTKGLSLFVVPKFLSDGEGRPTLRNGVACGALEHKMGIKASATCLLNFDGAIGWIVGEPHRGMHCMFTMMNLERFAIAVQGLGVAEAAYQGAVTYARERLQGRGPRSAAQSDKPAAPIIVHPDVRRMLLTMRAYTEGMRAFAQWVARALDRRERHPDAAERTAADDLVQLLTPVVKALFTDLGFEVANLGIQVFGGHGYIREHGMEQLVRDARVTQIYEGTNGVQALDLTARKLSANSGRLVQRFFAEVQSFLSATEADPRMVEFVQPLAHALATLQHTTAWIRLAAETDFADAAAGATEYLRLFGLVALAYLWGQMAAAALPHVEGPEHVFYRAKVGTARFYLHRLLPQVDGLAKAIEAGGSSVHSFADAAF